MIPFARQDGQQASVTKAIFSLLSARGAGMLMRIMASLIAARVAGPEAVGFVAWIGIFTIYVIWFTGGVYNGAERLVPILRAEERLDAVGKIWNVTSMVAIGSASLCFALGTVAGGWAAASGTNEMAWKLWCAGILSGISLFVGYVNATFTADNRLHFLNRHFFIEGLLWWVLLPLAWLGIAGLTSRTLLVALLPAIICLISARAFYKPKWDWPTAAMLIREGVPILFSRFLLMLSFGLDRTLIAILMDDRTLGMYVMAISVIGVMRMFQYAVSRVLTPTLGGLFGRTKSKKAVARAALKVLPPLLLFILPAILVGWYLIEPFTRWFLPDYLPGVPAARIALISGGLIASLGTNIFYVTVGHQKTLILMLIIGLIVQSITSLTLFRTFGNLESIAWGYMAGSLANFFLVNAGIIIFACSSDKTNSR